MGRGRSSRKVKKRQRCIYFLPASRACSPFSHAPRWPSPRSVPRAAASATLHAVAKFAGRPTRLRLRGGLLTPPPLCLCLATPPRAPPPPTLQIHRSLPNSSWKRKGACTTLQEPRCTALARARARSPRSASLTTLPPLCSARARRHQEARAAEVPQHQGRGPQVPAQPEVRDPRHPQGHGQGRRRTIGARTVAGLAVLGGRLTGVRGAGAGVGGCRPGVGPARARAGRRPRGRARGKRRQRAILQALDECA